MPTYEVLHFCYACFCSLYFLVVCFPCNWIMGQGGCLCQWWKTTSQWPLYHYVSLIWPLLFPIQLLLTFILCQVCTNFFHTSMGLHPHPNPTQISNVLEELQIYCMSNNLTMIELNYLSSNDTWVSVWPCLCKY